MSRSYCYHCAGKLEPKDERSWWCYNCQQLFFENVAACAEAIIVNDKQEVLVVTRAMEPYKGEADFPGGFVDFNETIEQALFRELQEELGLTKDDLSDPEYITSYHIPYPWGKDTTQVVVAVFLLKLQKDIKLEAHDDISAARFEKLDTGQLKEMFSYRNNPELQDKIKQAILS